ncbi:helix-turn-helix domain-containing protein [Nocardia sp. NPDC051570]|uniref:helix-turn-helix domain-containing protein n=1 Tax=Nocardia sp. NPDC051570 TaxID=3364324 RepID=UPI003792C4F1
MTITKWTGVEVKAVRLDALRVSQKELARILGYTEAVVRKWESRGVTITLAREYAAAMDTLYSRLDDAQRERFAVALSAAPADPPHGDRSARAVEARLPDLRCALDSHPLPEDGLIRPLGQLRDAVAAIVDDRLNSNYLHLACELPSLLAELHRAHSAFAGCQREQVSALLVQAYRAADAIAGKYGYFDLSARIIAMMWDAARTAGDELLLAMSAYVRTEMFFVNGRLATGRRLLEQAADTIRPGRSVQDAAAYGSLHMRAAVVAAREFRPSEARAHLDEAEQIASLVPESIYLGTAFGPSSVRIHRVSIAVELGDVGTALSVAQAWHPSREIPAERCSHFYIDVARAYMQASRRDDALQALRSARSVAPQHTNNHLYVRDMLAQLGGWH